MKEIELAHVVVPAAFASLLINLQAPPVFSGKIGRVFSKTFGGNVVQEHVY